MGCFNMSCAVTNMPIICGDEMVVALAAECEQMTSNVLPLFFVAEYNDYGTFENPKTDTIHYNWFSHFCRVKPDNGLVEIVREGVERNVKDILYSQDYAENKRVVFILKTVWDQIVEYQRNMCTSAYYYHNPDRRYEVNTYPSIIKRLHMKHRREQLEGREDLTYDEIQELREITMLSFRSSRGYEHDFSEALCDHVLNFCKKHQIDIDVFAKEYANIVDESILVSRFTNSINCNLITRYASQETYNDEQSVLVSMMYNRLQYLRRKWNE